MKIYSEQLVNASNGAMLMLVFIDKQILQTKDHNKLVGDVLSATEIYSEKTGIQTHVGGLPYMRTVLSTQVKDEMDMFLLLSSIITALILFIFFPLLECGDLSHDRDRRDGGLDHGNLGPIGL